MSRRPPCTSEWNLDPIRFCSFMKLSIFTGDAFCSGDTFSVPVFRKSKARFARYNLISSVDCLSCFPAFTGIFYPIVHGSRPTAVRLVMNILVFYLFWYIRELYMNVWMRLLLGGWSFDSVPVCPSHFQQVLISSQSCALTRFCGIILISMPIGHWMRTIFGFCRHRHGFFFIRQRIVFQGSFMLEPYFPAASIHLHRQYVSRMDITRIASSKVPFLTSFRSRSRFSGGSFYWSGTRSFL